MTRFKIQSCPLYTLSGLSNVVVDEVEDICLLNLMLKVLHIHIDWDLTDPQELNLLFVRSLTPPLLIMCLSFNRLELSPLDISGSNQLKLFYDDSRNCGHGRRVR